MSAPLQKTKLFLPAARAQLVERPRLLEQLDGVRAEGCRAALISAPAGSGKTTLVAQWLSRLNWPVGWVSLDARDNQPARFFAYLISALQMAVPGAGSEPLALLQLPGADLEEVVTLLVNDLSEAPGPFVLVVDDCHTITNPVLHHALGFLVEAQPPQMRLVLLSREDPAIQLARLRARGQLVELRQDDLRFTAQETAAFLNQGMGLSLTVEQIKALEARTEGWIAGLQMAALSLQRQTDPDLFIREFSGSHRFILDYLLEEVLTHQSAQIQDFLLKTAVLERMCAGLCAAVTGETSPNAQKLLEQLAKANLFVIPLDEERHWFRYHHLFGDLLLARLQAENPQGTQELHRRASDWCEENGDPRLAVEHALKAQDLQHAANLIECHAVERWQTVDLEFFLLVNRLPPEVLSSRPTLCLHSAWVYVMTAQAERVLPLVEAAERCLTAAGRIPEPTDAANRAFARTLRAYLADLQNQPVELDESFAQTFAAIPEENTGMRNSVAVVLGTIYFMEGDFSGAMGYFEDAIERDKRVDGTNAVPIAAMRITWVLQAQGRLQEAVRLLSEAEAYVRERGSRRFYISGSLNLLLGEILLEWNQLDAAEAQIREGLRLLEDWPIPAVFLLGFSLLARLQTARGDLAGARAALERVDTIQRANRIYPKFLEAAEQTRVQFWMAEQNRTALETWVRENASLAGLPLYFRHEARQIELCRAWLALGQKEEAAELLQRLERSASGRSGSRVAILALLAAARSEEPNRALAALEEALHLAEPEGYLRTFVNAGEPLPQILKAWLQHNRLKEDAPVREYARRMLAAFSAPETSGPKPPTQPAGLAEALSEREQEVLLLVARGLTNQQIAARLVISIRTVKKHIENIHGKLGVQNRTQAVARARELGLIRD
jgi:LuxR family transcriptional regulator, maltose regulon positive regulatory protein